jgi:hypothetical protein
MLRRKKQQPATWRIQGDPCAGLHFLVEGPCEGATQLTYTHPEYLHAKIVINVCPVPLGANGEGAGDYSVTTTAEWLHGGGSVAYEEHKTGLVLESAAEAGYAAEAVVDNLVRGGEGCAQWLPRLASGDAFSWNGGPVCFTLMRSV